MRRQLSPSEVWDVGANRKKGLFLSAKDGQGEASGRRSALRESLLSLWQVDIDQALRVREDRQTQN